MIFIDVHNYVGTGSQFENLLPIVAAFLGALAAVRYQYWLIDRRRKDDTLTEIAFTCDQLLRHAITAEKNQLVFKFQEWMSIKYASIDFKNELMKFGNISLKANGNFYLTKGLLMKYTRNLRNYDSKTADLMAISMSKVDAYKMRSFKDEFSPTEDDYRKMYEHCDKINNQIHTDIIDGKLGKHLIEIMALAKVNVHLSKRNT